jgi:hypothetical protein
MTLAVSGLVRIIGSIALAGSLSACNSPLARQETISLHAGDAVAWNKSVHTIDPWPVAASDTTIPVSGRRVAQAIENYETGLESPAAPPPVTLVPIAPLSPGAGGAPR